MRWRENKEIPGQNTAVVSSVHQPLWSVYNHAEALEYGNDQILNRTHERNQNDLKKRVF